LSELSNYDVKVTVLMPVYNGEQYLSQAISSILNQTFTDYEFLIINDGSTDRSVEIVSSYNDPRIKLIHNDTNIKLVETLNKGLLLSHGKYIARMDCDDISRADRLAEQVSFMESNQDVDICGTWIKYINGYNKNNWKPPINDDTIKCRLLFAPPLAHPSVMFRKDVMINNNLLYSSKYEHCEDYDLWVRSAQYVKFANINKVLLLYRIHSNNIGISFRQEQLASANEIRNKLLLALGISASSEDIDLHSSIAYGNYESSIEYLKRTERWLNMIVRANNKRMIYPVDVLGKVFTDLWYSICKNATGLGISTYKTFNSSRLNDICNIGIRKRIKLLLNCLV
jgi:glycosyltransferase involved in cell wall biosynthesis